MAKVAQEMVKKAGVNLQQLVELLVNNAAAELTTYYYYTILRVNLIGLDDETILSLSRRSTEISPLLFSTTTGKLPKRLFNSNRKKHLLRSYS